MSSCGESDTAVGNNVTRNLGKACIACSTVSDDKPPKASNCWVTNVTWKHKKRMKLSKNKRPRAMARSPADMQMLCNIFSILSLQLMKGSLFEQFLVLKNKNVCFIIFFSVYGHDS